MLLFKWNAPGALHFLHHLLLLLLFVLTWSIAPAAASFSVIWLVPLELGRWRSGDKSLAPESLPHDSWPLLEWPAEDTVIFIAHLGFMFTHRV